MKLRGTVLGCALGLASAVMLGVLLQSVGRLVLVTGPGAVVLGGLSGWTISRMHRWRYAVAPLLGTLCVAANAALSICGVALLDRGWGESVTHMLLQGTLSGLWGFLVLYWFSFPTGIVVGTLLALATRPQQISA